MNSAGLTMATLMVILRIPSNISVEVIVDPNPISISKASYFEACIKIENDPIHMSNIVLSAAPKVILKNRDSGRQMVGYCIEEEQDNGRFLKIITEGGREIKINRPQYNGDTGEWDVSIGCNDDLDRESSNKD